MVVALLSVCGKKPGSTTVAREDRESLRQECGGGSSLSGGRGVLVRKKSWTKPTSGRQHPES